jgi:hypothetical protein
MRLNKIDLAMCDEFVPKKEVSSHKGAISV